jgi:hypothetical protein
MSQQRIDSFSADERLIAAAVADARRVQEFIWGENSLRLRPYDADAWRRVFQKRVDAIAEIDITKPCAVVMLRKRLLQQAALSIAALAMLEAEQSGVTEGERHG